MPDVNARVAIQRLHDRARQLGYHQTQIRLIANEILDLADQVLEYLETTDNERRTVLGPGQAAPEDQRPPAD
jgi:hypothetical protein